jgi:hypothetical protein
MTAQILFTAGIIGTLVVGSISSEMNAIDTAWSKISLGLLTTSMLAGAFILWLFGWKFYLRVQSRLNVTRGILYLAIVTAFTCLTPLFFMLIEGKDNFFKEAFA